MTRFSVSIGPTNSTWQPASVSKYHDNYNDGGNYDDDEDVGNDDDGDNEDVGDGDDSERCYIGVVKVV